MSSIEKNKNAIREFTRVFKNEHQVDGITHLFAKNFKHNFRAPLAPGLQGLQDIGRMMNGAFPDVQVKELDLIATEDTVIERSYAVATHKGTYGEGTPFQAPATGKKIEWWEIHIYKFDKEGKICEHFVEMALLELLMQIGAVKSANG